MNSTFIENIKIALKSIKGHLLRTCITVSIIAIGIVLDTRERELMSNKNMHQHTLDSYYDYDSIQQI